MKDYISAIAEQDLTNELGTMHHNTSAVPLGGRGVGIEPRPTFPDASQPASGSYGRGAFIHKGVPLYVTESQIANSTNTTAITTANLNPLAVACFGILNDGTDRLTVVQNAGYTGAEGSLYYAGDSINLSIEKYVASGKTFTPSATNAEIIMTLADDGTRMFTLDLANTDLVYRYDLTTAWDITSTGAAPFSSYNPSDELGTTMGRGMAFGDSGTKMYLLSTTGDIIYQYTLAFAWDPNSATYASKSHDYTSEDSDIRGIAFNADGTTMILAGRTNDKVYEYDLSTGWELIHQR